MKTLKGLNSLPELSELQKEAVESGQQIKIKSFKRMLRDAIALSASKNIEDAEEKEQIKLKLMLEDDEIQLEDAEFKKLKEVIDSNPCGWFQSYHSQIGKIIREAGK